MNVNVNVKVNVNVNVNVKVNVKKDVMYFPNSDFPSDNFSSGNFPNVQSSKRQHSTGYFRPYKAAQAAMGAERGG